MGLPENCTLKLCGKWKHGGKNKITDVPGVKVGHSTIRGDVVNTGVTVLIPHEGNLFKEKLMAGCSIINGFGKSMGLLQLQELGTIETPIVLTNTMSIGTAYTALTKYMLKQNPDIGIGTGTVNCLVTECNDGRLNDIRGFHVEEHHVVEALAGAKDDFDEGAVGSGSGMCCLGLKGGIGSSSRVVPIDGKSYTIGAFVLSNFGSAGDLVIDGVSYDTRLAGGVAENVEKDRGSIIIIIATDIPLSERQLSRVAKRGTIALGRTGSYCGNGSGDIAIAFTTANRMPHYSDQNILDYKMFYDENIDMVFEASVEAVEEAIISSLYHAETTTGIRGKKAVGLKDFLRI